MTYVTESEPTPHTHSVGVGGEGEPLEGSTRASAPARESKLSVPPVPELLHTLFVGDPESSASEMWRQLLRRSRHRIDYALHGDWTAPNYIDDDRERIAGTRWAYLLLYTIPIAIPIAVALDVLDWATHPAGRLLATALVVWLITVIL